MFWERRLLVEGADPTIKTSLLCRHQNWTPKPGRPPTVQLPTSSPAQLALLRNIAFHWFDFFALHCCRRSLWLWWICSEWLSHSNRGRRRVSAERPSHIHAGVDVSRDILSADMCTYAHTLVWVHLHLLWLWIQFVYSFTRMSVCAWVHGRGRQRWMRRLLGLFTSSFSPRNQYFSPFLLLFFKEI